MEKLKIFAQKHWLLLSTMLTALGVVIWIGGSILLDVIYFNDPRHQDQKLKSWMTPRYVVMSYDLPRDVVAEILQLNEGDRRKKLGRIADEMGMSMGGLTDMVRGAADRYREANQ